MWYPNRPQWLAIWFVVLLAIATWLGTADSSVFAVRLHVSLLAIGALIVWTGLSRERLSEAPSAVLSEASGPEPDIEGQPRNRAALFQETEIRLLTGVHGWLGLFCFAQLFIQPLFVAWPLLKAFRIEATLADRLRQSPLLMTSAAMAVYGLVVGIALARRSANAVWHAKFYLQCAAIAMFCLIAWASITLSPAGAGLVSEAALRGIISATVWRAYFSRSRRVALTYGEAAVKEGPTYKQTAAATLVICALVGTPAIALRAIWPNVSQPWTVYGPIGSGFQVTLPGAPTVKKSPRTLVTQAIVETPSDAAAFVISYFDLSPGIEISPDVLLDKMRDATVKDPPMKVTDTHPIWFEQYPGREYLGDFGQLRIRGRLFLVGQRAYEVRAVTRIHPTREQLDAANRFLNSFALPPNSLSGRVAVGQPIHVALKTVGHLPEPIEGIVKATLASGAWIKLRAVDIDRDETTAHTGRAIIKAVTSTLMTASPGRKYANFTFGPTFVATAWFEDVDWDETRLLAERDYGPSFQFDTKGVDFGSWLRRVRAQVYGNWLIPYSAIGLHGNSRLRFTVHRNGAITDVVISQPSTVDAFNKAAFQALTSSDPIVPLPLEYPDERVVVTAVFCYNEKPPGGGLH